MKAKIFISGGISGNGTIFQKLRNYTDWNKTRFGGYVVDYASVGEAKQDLKYVFQSILDDYHPEPAPAELYKGNGYLRYDASTARIEY